MRLCIVDPVIPRARRKARQESLASYFASLVLLRESLFFRESTLFIQRLQVKGAGDQ